MYMSRRQKTGLLGGLGLLIILIIVLLLLISNCNPPNARAWGMRKMPEGFVPDDEVVYLRQQVEYGPIRYEPVWTDPYDWTADVIPDYEKPMFLEGNFGFRTVMEQDFQMDAQLYLELQYYLKGMTQNTDFLAGRELLSTASFDRPRQREITTGREIKTFTNAIEYEYPPITGARITKFDRGDISIELPDGNTYLDFGDHYLEKDELGQVLYSVYRDDENFSIRDGEDVYGFWATGSSVQGESGEIVHFNAPIPQYQFQPSESDIQYVFFLDNEDIESEAIILPSGLRLDRDSDGITVSFKDQSIDITEHGQKFHELMDISTSPRKSLETLSVFYPEGLRIYDFDKDVTQSDLNPAWPEEYVVSELSGYNIFTTKKDLNLIDRLDGEKLAGINSELAALFGTVAVENAALIIPPDLESYTKLFIGREGALINWYPAGFQGRTLVVLWPLSVPVYATEEGQNYIWNNEIYDTVIHEMVHLAIDRITGVFNPVPIWLNEGMAVWVEAEYSESARIYWDTTFEGLRRQKRLMDWDTVTVSSTSEFPIGDARVHYAQSYTMVKHLAETYGREPLVEYIRTFNSPENDSNWYGIIDDYKTNFQDVFGISWEENVEVFEQSVRH